MYKAYLRTTAGVVRVFPRSKKVTMFRSIPAAQTRLESLKIAGQGIIAPADWDCQDFSRVVTVAL